ncbi:MAG: hypothetical protein QW328_05115 [Nitrososphaerota archaeon]
MMWKYICNAVKDYEKKFEKFILWIDDPKKYEYLRVSTVIKSTRTPPKLKFSTPGFFKLVGFLWPPEKLGRRIYSITVFWLKNYDRGAPDENEVYGITDCRPSESMLTAEIMDMYDIHVFIGCGGKDETKTD